MKLNRNCHQKGCHTMFLSTYFTPPLFCFQLWLFFWKGYPLADQEVFWAHPWGVSWGISSQVAGMIIGTWDVSWVSGIDMRSWLSCWLFYNIERPSATSAFYELLCRLGLVSVLPRVYICMVMLGLWGHMNKG